MTHIICGSKMYRNISFDNLVDHFDIIWRHNFLISNNNYGKKPSSRQVLNCHMYEKYKKKTSKQAIYQTYKIQYPSLDYSYITRWHDYVHDTKKTSQIIYFPNN